MLKLTNVERTGADRELDSPDRVIGDGWDVSEEKRGERDDFYRSDRLT